MAAGSLGAVQGDLAQWPKQQAINVIDAYQKIRDLVVQCIGLVKDEEDDEDEMNDI